MAPLSGDKYQSKLQLYIAQTNRHMVLNVHTPEDKPVIWTFTFRY